MEIKDKDFSLNAVGSKAVDEAGKLAREREKTKRLLIGAACLFLIVAALIVIFAPAGKENIAYFIGAALLIMALGAIGVTRFDINIPIFGKISTTDDKILIKNKRKRKTTNGPTAS